jgi:putative ABC transport system permease protein
MGMAIGLSCCLIIGLFIKTEIGYDRYHSKYQRIFRVASDLKANSSTSSLAAAPAPWAPLLQNDFPQIENSVRLLKDNRSVVGLEGEQRFYEEDVLFSDS